MNPEAFEVNFDGLIGPTHNYSGLSYGNRASMENRKSSSSPKKAALQGLEKMWLLATLGLKQAILPPHERPHLPTLKSLGYQGSDADILSECQQKNPEILAACSSAAAMWVANAATPSPSIDSIDPHVHFTPANLSFEFHRAIEAEFTAKVLKAIFKDPVYFQHHASLPSGSFFADEGAANHTRFCKRYGDIGLHLFVYGRQAFKPNALRPTVFPARQSLEASQAIARLHQLYPDRVIYAQQNPRAIDAGVFHNDVASVGNRNVFIYHESAFAAPDQLVDVLRGKAEEFCDMSMHFVKIEEAKVSLPEAVSSYLFNSQLLSNGDESMILVAPLECRNYPLVQAAIENIIYGLENPIKEVHYVDLSQSMRNGGGPACLRLRVVLNEKELAAVHPGIFLTERLYKKLKDWINHHYRDQLLPKDLGDTQLLQEGRQALDELTQILELGPLYSFQK